MPLSSMDKLVVDYSATLVNPFGFNVLIAKRSEFNRDYLKRIGREAVSGNVETDFKIERLRTLD